MTSTREIYNSSPDSIFDNFPITTTPFDNTFPTTVGGVGGVERGGGGEENKSVLSYNSGFTELINERYNNNNTQRHAIIVDWPSPPPANSNNNNESYNDVDIYNDSCNNSSMRRRDPSPPHTTNQSSKVNLARQIIYKSNNNNTTNSMTDATGQATREGSKRFERGVDPISSSIDQSISNNATQRKEREEVANNNSSGKKKLDPPSSLVVDSSTSAKQKQRLSTTAFQSRQQQPITQSKQQQPTKQSIKQSTQHTSTTSNNNIMQQHFQKHNVTSPISGNSSGSIVGTINTSNSILTDEMNDEELLQRRLRLHKLQKQQQSRGSVVRQSKGGIGQSNVKPRSVNNQHSSMSTSGTSSSGSTNKSNVKQSSKKKRLISQKTKGSDKMRDQLQKHLGVQQSNKEKRVVTSQSDQRQQINSNGSNHQVRQEEGMLQQLYSPLERSTNKESSRPASTNNVKSEASKSDSSMVSSHPHDGPVPLAIIQRQRQQKRNGIIDQSQSTTSSSAVAVVQQQRPPTHPDSSRTISPPNDTDNNNVSSNGRVQSRHRIKGAYTTSSTSNTSTNPSPTSVISSSTPSSVQQSRGSAQQPHQHTTTQRTLLSPVRSDHSADLAAGGNFHGSVNFGNVRRRIFDNNSNGSSSLGVENRIRGGSSSGRGGCNGRVRQDPPASSPNRNTTPKSLASSRSIFRLNPSVIKSRASPPTTIQGGSDDKKGNAGRSVSGRDVSPSTSVDAFDECPQLSPGSSNANNVNISGDSFDRRGNLTVVSWNDDEEDDTSYDKGEESIDKGDEYTIPLGEKLSKLHNQPNITSMKRSGLGRSFDSATNQSKVSRYSSKSGMSYGGGNSIQPSVESECVRQNAEIAIAMGDMMEFFLGVDDEEAVAEDVMDADNSSADMSSPTPQPKQQMIPTSFNRQNLPIRKDMMKQPSLVSGTSGASTSIFEAFEVAPTNPHGHTTKQLSINDYNVQHQAYVKKRGTKKRKALLPLVSESTTSSKDIGGSTSFDQGITRRVSSEDSEPPLKVSRSFDSSAVASIQPSIDSECVRQNDNIAIQMGDMMQMFMAAGDAELPVDEQVYVKEDIYVDEESYEDQIMHSGGGGLEPLAEDEVYESESSPGHHVQYDYQDPRSTKTNQYTTLNPGRVVSPSTTMSGSSPGSSHMTSTASNIKVIPQSRLSSHLLMPSTSEEEYDDPSVFGSTSMMSDSSSEMTPMITRAPTVQARQQPPSQKKQVTNKKNHNSLVNKNKNLANFLDSFSDHLLRGCNDNDDDDASTDVFFVNNSQFGKDTSQFNDDSQFSSTSSSGVGINQFDLPKHPLNQALPVNVNNDDKLEEEEEEVITDQQIAQFQRWKQFNKSNQTPNNDRGLPKPSTFMSAKDRSRIRKHDTTPQRTNTSRAQRGRMSLRRAPSFTSEVSMSSIKEDMDEEEDEIVLEPMVVEEGSDESSSSSSDEEHVISSESEGSTCSSGDSSDKQVTLEPRSEAPTQDPPSTQDPPTLSSPTRKSTGGNELNINRQLSSDASRQSSDPPDADDMIKMTNREMRKGSSLAWNSSNGLNDDELYDTNHLPSRANRAATLAGRLNLLSITSNNASFQKYYHDSQKSRAQRRRGVRSLYRSNYEPDIESIQEEEYEASALEEVMDQEDGGSDDNEDEDMIDSWDQGEEDEVVSECYSHDDFVKDFKEIMAREKAIATAVEAKKQHQSPLTMEASKRVSNNGRNHQKQGRDDKATVATSRRNKSGSGRAPKPIRRPPTQPIRRQQSSHPHDIPQELPKSRLEEKLLNMKKADRRHNTETSSVATSDLGSLISRNSDKSHVIGVPKTIFHRTHPSSSRGGSSVVGGRGGSVSSQMSSLQNTTPGSATAPSKTPTTVAELRARGYNKAIVPSILPPDRNDDADTLDEDNSLLVSLPGNNDDEQDMKMLELEGYTKPTQPPTIKRKTAPQITSVKETYDGVNVLLDTKPRWSPTADLKKIDEELQRTQAQNSKQKASHVDTSSVDKKKNVTVLPAAAIQKSNSVDSDVDGKVRSSISIQETPPRVADDQLPKMRIGTETWKLKYDMVDRTSVPPPLSAAPTPTRSNIKSSPPLSIKNISPLRKKQVSSNKVAKKSSSSVRPLETIGTIDNGMNQGRIKIQVTSRTPKQMPPSALRNSAPPVAADPTASSINNKNNPSLEMKRHNSVPIQRHSSLKDAASLQRIRSLDAQKALSFWKYLNPHDTNGTTAATSKAETNKTSRSSPIPPPPPPPGPPPQQRQIPSSFNPPRRVHQPSIVSGTSHSSIFEAFEIAPLHTAHGNTRLELNSFGVHHAYVKRGGSNAKKRVGFPETQQMSRQTRSTPISSSGGIEPPSQSINTPIPLGSRSRTYECQSSSGSDMVAAPLTSRSRSYDNDVQEFEVMLNNRNLQAPPPPPPPPPSRGSKWVRMGWKKMSNSNSRIVRGSVQSLKKNKSLTKTQNKGGTGQPISNVEPNKKWVARTNADGSVEFIQQVIPASMYK